MSEIIERDPALQKLLDEMANWSPEDLDEEAPDDGPGMAEVWVAFCEGRHLIPLNRLTRIEFGEWHGPPMPATEIILHAQYKGHYGRTQWAPEGDEIIHPGCNLIGDVTVRCTMG